jgi:hypothetical protein
MDRLTLEEVQEFTPRTNARSHGGGRGRRRKEENSPSGNYLAILRNLGPREGETRFSYEVRLAAVARARELIFEAWILTGRNIGRAMISLGCAGAACTVLRQYGLNHAALVELETYPGS